jgi:O-antigen/teichoic acid export membrane protein
LIRFLYTDEFLPSALALQILIWDVPLLMFTGFCGNMTTIIGEERAAARIYAINAIANIILNFYAIPHFGIVGASLVTVVTDLIGALQFHFLLRQKLNLPGMTWIFGRILIAAALMGFVLKLAGDLNMFLLIGLGIVIYGSFALGLRLLDDRERNLISRFLPWRNSSQAVKKAI